MFNSVNMKCANGVNKLDKTGLMVCPEWEDFSLFTVEFLGLMSWSLTP